MTQEAEVGRSLSLRPVRFTKQVPGWQGLCRETLSQKPNIYIESWSIAQLSGRVLIYPRAKIVWK